MSFENFPYSNFHDMNLDWIILKIKELVQEWAEMKKGFADISDSFDELKEYVTNYFDNVDIQEEVSKKLDEMAADGSLERIFGNEIVLFSNINDPKSVAMTKIGSYGTNLSGHTFQGMCGNSTHLYMAHHVSDTSNMYIMEIDIESREILRDVDTGATGHFNSLTLLNNVIYASGGSGTSYNYMAEISVDDLKLIKTVKLAKEFWSIYPTVIQNNYNPILCGFESHSPIMSILTTRQGENKYTTFARYPFNAVDGIMQGGCIVNNALWQLFGSDYNNYNNHNLICVYGLNGCYMSTIYLVTEKACEGEDIVVTSSNGTVYMNDLEGNIYSGSLARMFKQEYTNGFNIPANQPTITACYNPYNGSEEWVNGEGKVCSTFYLNPYTYTTTNQMVGWCYLNSLKVPITYNPNTGVIDATTTFYLGEKKILFLHAEYTRISDSTSYGYSFSNNSYISVLNTETGESETKYGSDIVNHTNYNGRWYMSYLVQINIGSIVPFSI